MNTRYFRGQIMAGQKNGKAIEILLVEDNPGCVQLTEESFKEINVSNNLHSVNNGIDALDYLRKKGKYQKVSTPDLILLDLNLPKKDGRKVLAEIKRDNELKHIPVVVLTVSDDEKDILKSHDLEANCYITKPIDLDKFIDVIRFIDDFWLTVIKGHKDSLPIA
ncbi:response regulator [Candidatus Margulisiibacteriota bacterium]